MMSSSTEADQSRALSGTDASTKLYTQIHSVLDLLNSVSAA